MITIITIINQVGQPSDSAERGRKTTEDSKKTLGFMWFLSRHGYCENEENLCLLPSDILPIVLVLNDNIFVCPQTAITESISLNFPTSPKISEMCFTECSDCWLARHAKAHSDHTRHSVGVKKSTPDGLTAKRELKYVKKTTPIRLRVVLIAWRVFYFA